MLLLSQSYREEFHWKEMCHSNQSTAKWLENALRSTVINGPQNDVLSGCLQGSLLCLVLEYFHHWTAGWKRIYTWNLQTSHNWEALHVFWRSGIQCRVILKNWKNGLEMWDAGQVQSDRFSLDWWSTQSHDAEQLERLKIGFRHYNCSLANS